MFLIKFIFCSTYAQRILSNNVFFACVLGSASLTGSFVSIFVICALIWPFLWFGRYGEFRSAPAEVKLVAAAFALFFLVEAIGCIVYGGEQALSEAVENLPFLAILPIWWAIQEHPRQLLTTLIKVVALPIALLSAFFALVLLLTFGTQRVELSAGNPNVLSIVATILYLILAIGIAEDNPIWPRFWLSAGLFGAVIVILLTGSRIMWLAILVVPPLVILIMRPTFARFHPRVLAIVLVFAALVALTLYKPIMQRIQHSQTEIEAISDGDLTTSIGLRIQLWKAGLQIFRANPWLGVGPGNYQAVMAAKTEAENGTKISFSHAHNMFINFLVRDGMLGLVTLLGMFVVPLAIALRNQCRNCTSKKPFQAFLCGMHVVYLIAGSTGLTIGHDITDSIFIVGTVFAAYGLFFANATDLNP